MLNWNFAEKLKKANQSMKDGGEKRGGLRYLAPPRFQNRGGLPPCPPIDDAYELGNREEYFYISYHNTTFQF